MLEQNNMKLSTVKEQHDYQIYKTRVFDRIINKIINKKYNLIIWHTGRYSSPSQQGDISHQTNTDKYKLTSSPSGNKGQHGDINQMTWPFQKFLENQTNVLPLCRGATDFSQK